MTLELDVYLHDGYAVAAFRGEADVSNSKGALSAIAAVAALHQVAVVDLSALEFIDCGVLNALLRLQRRARQSGGNVLLVAPVASALRLLRLTGMDEALGIHPNAAAALASIGGSSQTAKSRRAERAGCPATGPPALSGSLE